jgi:hypothetical protein
MNKLLTNIRGAEILLRRDFHFSKTLCKQKCRKFSPALN